MLSKIFKLTVSVLDKPKVLVPKPDELSLLLEHEYLE